MHPNLAALYRRTVGALESALIGTPVECAQARGIIRSFVQAIVLRPIGDRRGAGGLVAEVDGSIAAILDFAATVEQRASWSPESSGNGSVVQVVPGAGVL